MSLARHVDFNKLWAGQTISNFGDKISLLALPTIVILVFDGGPLEVAVLGVLRFLPFLLLAPIAGLVADRFSRRTVMLIADIGRFIALGSVALAFALDSITLSHVYIVAAVAGVLTTFFEVAYQAWLPKLVGTENLVEGNTKLQISRSLAEAVGAGAGGAMIQFLSVAKAVALDAFTFLASFIALMLIRQRDAREHVEERKTTAANEMREGLRTLFGTPILRSLFTSNVVVNLGAAMADSLFIIYAYKVLGLRPGQVGLIFTVMSVFVIIGAILSETVGKALTIGRTLVITAVVFGVGYILLPQVGATAGFVGVLVAVAVLGFVSPMYDIHVLSLVQGVTPNEQMGRVSGTALSAVYGALALGHAISGGIGELLGITTALAVAGAIIVVGGLTLLAGPVRAVKTQPTTPDPEPQKEEAQLTANSL